MIEHLVLINFRPETPPEVRDECVQRLRDLANLVPGQGSWRVGLNVTEMSRAWDLAIAGEFNSLDDMFDYRAHPTHRQAQAFVDQWTAQTVGADFEFPNSP